MPRYEAIEPNSVSSGNGLVISHPAGGPASIANISEIMDGDPETYWYTTGPLSWNSVGFTSYTLGANERCGGYRYGATFSQKLELRLSTTGHNSVAKGSTASPTDVGEMNYQTGLGGVPLTQSQIDNLEIQLWTHSGGPTFTAREVWMDLLIWSKTKSRITYVDRSPAHSGGMAVGLSPEIQFDAGMAAGDTVVNMVSQYEVKLFTKAVADGVGFDPQTSASVYSSGPVNVPTIVADFVRHKIPEGYITGTENYVVFTRTHVFVTWGAPLLTGDWSDGVHIVSPTAPTIDATGPTGTITTTSRPIVAWTYDQPQGEPQGASRVRVFIEPSGGWTGFNPDTATPWWVGTSSVATTRSIQVSRAAENQKNYRAYVDVVGGSYGVPSNVDYVSYYVDLPLPTTPTLSAVPNNSQAAITVTLNNISSDPVAKLSLEKSMDGGSTWECVQFATNANTRIVVDEYYGGSPTLVIQDSAVPLGKPVLYRGWVTSYSTTVPIDSLMATAASSVSSNTVWIRDAYSPSSYGTFKVTDTWLERTRSKQHEVHLGLGSKKPKVVKGEAQYQTFTLNFSIFSQADMDKIMSILEGRGTLIVQTPKEFVYAEVMGDYTTREWLWDELRNEDGKAYQLSVPLVEVGTPSAI